MYDTHCHLNFSRFKKNYKEVIQRATESGVTHCMVPATDLYSAQKAIEIAELYPHVYAAIGIHPHHVFELMNENQSTMLNHKIDEIRQLINHEKVLAIGEIGLDRHLYDHTKYQEYHASEEFIDLQKKYLVAQIELAQQYNKTVILHNREATADMLEILQKNLSKWFAIKFVFHCCEPNFELLKFAIKHSIYIGVDGDITYLPEKQKFVKHVPLDLLVLETDSPFLLPEPLRSRKEYPNEPRNLPVIADCIANILNKTKEEIAEITNINAQRLFQLK